MVSTISVVVPVYNTEKYLDECIQSILNQSFTNFELLLIDDGSTDCSGAICDQYAAKDERVRVFHKKNGGVSSARNLGLNEARGEWIAFVDSDDWVERKYLEELILHADNVDMVISSQRMYRENDSYIPDERYEGLVKSEHFSILFSDCGMGKYTYCWGKLFRLSFINNQQIRFHESMSMGEDHVFLYTYILNAHNVFVLNAVNYNYRYVKGGLSKRQNYNLDMEYYGYVQIHSVISRIVSCFHITDPNILMQLKNISVRYLNRILEALYMSSVKKKKRINILRSLDFSIVDYESYNLFKRWILKFIFSHKLFYLYDLKSVIMKSKKIIHKN